MIHPMDDKVVVITGGNSGIGLETSVALAGAGARIVMGCRNPTKATAAVDDVRARSGNEDVESRPLDLADLTSVRAFADGVSDLDRIDVLVNNAGLVLGERQETAQGFEATFGTNHLGHFLLTGLLLEQVRASTGGRIVCVASEAHRAAVGGLSWGDLDRHARYNSWRAYGESKLANILHAEGLARRLEGTGVVAHSLHPGSVRTNFGREGDTHGLTARIMEIGNPLLTPADRGAETSVHVASSPEAGRSTGRYWTRCRPGTVARWTRRPGDVEQLWATSSRMLAAAG
jgi:NAD(P)-dependent dehydrogenase (short-subunit alcohol dehydrogenase family)